MSHYFSGYSERNCSSSLVLRPILRNHDLRSPFAPYPTLSYLSGDPIDVNEDSVSLATVTPNKPSRETHIYIIILGASKAPCSFSLRKSNIHYQFRRSSTDKYVKDEVQDRSLDEDVEYRTRAYLSGLLITPSLKHAAVQIAGRK